MTALQRLRRNHALEHASIAVLFERSGRREKLAALSDPRGFTVISPFDAEELAPAIGEAASRLRVGETRLAVTDDCGTTLLLGGAAGAALVLLTAARRPIANFPVALLSLAAFSRFAPRLGRTVQEAWTTDADLADLEVRGVQRLAGGGGWYLVRVATS